MTKLLLSFTGICARNWLQLKSYEHFVEKDTRILENEDAKILWDFSIQTERKIEHNKPDVVLLDKSKKVCFVLDAAMFV